MKSLRGLSAALALAVVSAAPLAAQETGLAPDEQRAMVEEGASATAPFPMMGEMKSSMIGSLIVVDAGPAAQALSRGPESARPRARRASGPSRLRPRTRQPEATPATSIALHPDRDRMRRATGPTRFQPAILGWHEVDLSTVMANAGEHPRHRSSGPSRIPWR
jgi:hypothetical protein